MDIYGEWVTSDSSIGAGIDSYYEYMLKSAILFGNDTYMDMFQDSLHTINHLLVDPERPSMHRVIHMFQGYRYNHNIESLAAFWPGVLALYGDVEGAKHHWLPWHVLWQRYGALPERYNVKAQKISVPDYPLRPEHVESTYMLYQATKDHTFLDASAMMLDTLANKTASKCGFAPLANVVTGKQKNRMDSFWISETLKYFYLTFDLGITLSSYVEKLELKDV